VATPTHTRSRVRAEPGKPTRRRSSRCSGTLHSTITGRAKRRPGQPLSPLCPSARSLPRLLRWSGALPGLLLQQNRLSIAFRRAAETLHRPCITRETARLQLHEVPHFLQRRGPPTASKTPLLATNSQHNCSDYYCGPACSSRCSSLRRATVNLLRRKRNSSTSPLTIAALSTTPACNRRLDHHQPIIGR